MGEVKQRGRFRGDVYELKRSRNAGAGRGEFGAQPLFAVVSSPVSPVQ